MTQKGGKESEARLRIDPVLVDKFRRLHGGINEIGTKIVQDLGLRYQFDKIRGTFDLIGPDTEILGLAVETLRFWVEDDVFPDTGITCQVGYPNRSTIIWRFHGDFAKKFDHLFAEDISKLKLIPSVNVKAVPTKRNPEYIELYCHFSVYHQVKGDVIRISRELSRICQDDFFIPISDALKAREFARSKINDSKVLYALKEYPDNKVRVWIFARDQLDVIRARKEWVLHVGIQAKESEFTQTVAKANSIRSASFYGHPASELASDISDPTGRDSLKPVNNQGKKQSKKKPMAQTSLNLSTSRTRLTSKSKASSISSRQTRADNPNFPRPPDFVYPIQRNPTQEENAINTSNDVEQSVTNPFIANAEFIEDLNAGGTQNNTNLTIGKTKWIKEEDTNLYPTKHYGHSVPNRIYLHHEVDSAQSHNQQTLQENNQNELELAGKVFVHPEKNVNENERYKPTSHSKLVLSRETDPQTIPAFKEGNKVIRRGKKGTAKKTKVNVNATTRQKRPVLKANKPPSNIRYNINVNGLDIYMYKKNISKLTNMDALVNVVSSNLKEGGQIATDIFTEAGKKIKDELSIYLRIHGEPKMGENVVTSAGKLPALGLIHVVSPVWKKYTVWEECATDMHKAIYDTLKTAETHKYRRIGIPTIGSESYFGIPNDLVAEVFVKALIDYSMGMGPMYPVLEIHLVDTDPSMLTYIKDAYESWASSPSVADMTHHISKIESDPVINDVNEMSKRSQSVVSLGSMPTHRSENMVTFTGQSYTEDGEQKWTFEVLRKLAVHVYTGSVLKLENSVEAIVCAVDINMKGSLAKQIQSLGGKAYKLSLKNARGNRSLVEGDVLISDAGDLGMRKIIHSVIAAPIRHITQENISRLDHIYAQLFHEANQHRIRVLAIPLIGTGRLRERLEVEQCSLQLIDNIIELCLTLGRSLKLKELHLVNTHHVMTQCLTQALRIRAQTKLRVENEPIVPSRQDVFTKSGRVRGTPDGLSVKSVNSDKSMEKTVTNRVNDNSKDEVTNKSYKAEEKNPNKKNNVPDNANTLVSNRKKDLTRVQNNNSKYHKRSVENVVDNNRNAPYLSRNNLEKHNRLFQNTLRKDKTDNAHEKISTEQNKNHELTPSEKNQLLKKAKDLLTDRKRQQRKRSRIIQRSSDFIFLKSKADSYKTIFEKKQKYAEISHREEQLNLRKTQSSDDISKKKIADEILETFKNEREKLSKQKLVDEGAAFGIKLENDNTNIKGNDKTFTRDTTHRYKSLPEADEAKERFKSFNRAHVDELSPGNKDHSEIKTSRSDNNKVMPKFNKRRRERYLNDIEREDQYMMDMDFLAKELEERLTEKNLEKCNDNLNSDVEKLKDRGQSNFPNNRHLTPEIYANRNSSEKDEAISQQHLSPKSNIKHSFKTSRIIQDEDKRKPQHQKNSKNVDEYFKSHDTTQEAIIPKRHDDDVPTIKYSNVAINDATNHDNHFDTTNDQEKLTLHDEIHRKKSEKMNFSKETGQQNTTFMSNSEQKNKHFEGKVQFVQSHNNTPRHVNEKPKVTKTIDWKNSRKVDKELLFRFSEQRRARIVPQVDEVRIRDKLKLQLNVIDRKIDDSERIEREKRKIKRFWEVVDGEKVKIRDEKEMFGEIDEKEKMLVAKLTKERKMSSKSKSTKQSKGSVVTHAVGDFNVTLEVAN